MDLINRITSRIMAEILRSPVLWVHADLDDAGLDAYEVRIYLRITRRAGERGCFESIRSMAESCQIGEHKTRAALNALWMRGMIAVQERPGKTSVWFPTERSVWGTVCPIIDEDITDIERRRITALQHLREQFKAKKEELRKIVFERDGKKCSSCGAVEEITLDHIVPLSDGGTNDPSNLQPLCMTCNRKKGTLHTRYSSVSGVLTDPSVPVLTDQSDEVLQIEVTPTNSLTHTHARDPVEVYKKITGSPCPAYWQTLIRNVVGPSEDDRLHWEALCETWRDSDGWNPKMVPNLVDAFKQQREKLRSSPSTAKGSAGDGAMSHRSSDLPRAPSDSVPTEIMQFETEFASLKREDWIKHETNEGIRWTLTERGKERMSAAVEATAEPS